MDSHIFKCLVGFSCIAAIFQFAQQFDVFNRYDRDERLAPPSENNALFPVCGPIDYVRELIPRFSRG